jgi:hypothetical protein
MRPKMICIFEVDAKFLEKYQNRRIELHCANGAILRGHVGCLAEEDELGFDFYDVEFNGKKLDYDIVITEPYVESFVPLDGENSEKLRR